MTKKDLITFIEPQANSWLDLMAENPSANIFHHPAWLELLAQTYGYQPFLAVVKNEKGQITAGVPLIEITSLTRKKSWISLPFTDHCAPLAINSQSLEILQEGLLEKTNQRRNLGVELRWDYQFLPLTRQAEHVLTLLPLAAQETEISQNIKRREFAKIEEARQNGVQVEQGTSRFFLEKFYQLHLESRQRQGVPIQPWRFFQNLQEKLLQTGLGFILLSRVAGEYLSGAIYLHWNQTLTYKFGATNQTGRRLLANDPLVWEAICWGCEHRYQTLDWGKTEISNQGLRQFKRRWGGQEIPLVYSQNYPVPTGKSLRTKIMPWFKKFLHHTPLWVCRTSGELLYRHFGY